MRARGDDAARPVVGRPRRSLTPSPLPGVENVWANSQLTPSGDRLAVVYSTGVGFIWPVTPSSWKQHACAVAGRTLTKREWELYLPERSYDPACR